MTPAEIEVRLKEIDLRITEMEDTYHGCDWCCGGGDEEMSDLIEEKRQLERGQPDSL